MKNREKYLGRDIASEFGFRTIIDPQYPVSKYILDVDKSRERVPKTAIMTVVELEP
jgi:hypothetical protein